MKKVIRRIKLRKGRNRQRTLIVPEEGEPIYIVDTKQVYVGDNSKYGGNNSSYRNVLTKLNTKPSEANPCDIVYFESTGDTKIVDNDGSLITIKTNTSSCCKQMQIELNIINNLLNRLQNECCGGDNRLVTDDGVDIFTDNDNWFVA